jgi:copper chaperone CopZ
MTIREEVSEVPGVEAVDVDVDSKVVVVRGESVEDAAVREALANAGYEPA